MPVSHTASEGIAQRVKGEGRVSGKDGGRLWVGWQLMDEGSRGKRTLEKMQFEGEGVGEGQGKAVGRMAAYG